MRYMENKYYYYKQQFSYENVRFLNEKNTHTKLFHRKFKADFCLFTCLV